MLIMNSTLSTWAIIHLLYLHNSAVDRQVSGSNQRLPSHVVSSMAPAPSHNDYARIIALDVTCCIVSITCIVLRFLVRLRHVKRVQMDDWLMLAAVVSVTVSRRGFG